jgi:hypothetical protein
MRVGLRSAPPYFPTAWAEVKNYKKKFSFQSPPNIVSNKFCPPIKPLDLIDKSTAVCFNYFSAIKRGNGMLIECIQTGGLYDLAS